VERKYHFTVPNPWERWWICLVVNRHDLDVYNENLQAAVQHLLDTIDRDLPLIFDERPLESVLAILSFLRDIATRPPTFSGCAAPIKPRPGVNAGIQIKDWIVPRTADFLLDWVPQEYYSAVLPFVVVGHTCYIVDQASGGLCASHGGPALCILGRDRAAIEQSLRDNFSLDVEVRAKGRTDSRTTPTHDLVRVFTQDPCDADTLLHLEDLALYVSRLSNFGKPLSEAAAVPLAAALFLARVRAFYDDTNLRVRLINDAIDRLAKSCVLSCATNES
jgi:hypothetical protein